MRVSAAIVAAAAAIAVSAAAASAAVTAAYGEAQLIATTKGAGAKPPIRQTATYPNAASGGVLDATAAQQLTLLFSVADAATGAALAPHQAFVRFMPAAAAATGAATYFVATPDTAGSAAGAHRFSIDLSDRKALATLTEPGTYNVEIIVGDANIANPVQWQVGTVKIAPAQPPAKSPPPLYTTPLLHESDTTLKPLREIAHTFRAPEKRPPTVISIAAAGLVVLAVVVWIGHVLSIPGLKLALPLAASIWALAFFGGVAAILALFAAYWLRLTMFTTLGYLALLALPTAFAGRQLLVAVQAAAADTKEE